MFDLYVDRHPWSSDATLTITGERFALWELYDLIWEADEAGKCHLRMEVPEPYNGELTIRVFWMDTEEAIDFLEGLWYDEPELTPMEIYLQQQAQSTQQQAQSVQPEEPTLWQLFVQALAFDYWL